MLGDIKTIKYGKIYVRHNQENMSFFDYFNSNILGNELPINPTTDIGIIFDIEPDKIYGTDEIMNIVKDNIHKYNSSIKYKLFTETYSGNFVFHETINYENIQMFKRIPRIESSQTPLS
jgi:hypothetical protein